MTTTHCDALKDVAKPRRSYLGRLAWLRAASLCGSLITIVSGTLLILTLLGAGAFFLNWVYWAILAGLAIACGSGTWLFLAAQGQSLALPPAPSVREEIDALDLRYVLVRPSETQCVSARIRVRAADRTADATGAGQLLRAAQAQEELRRRAS